MGLPILEHRILYRDERFFAAFPGIVASPEGGILLAFRRAPDHRWMLGDVGEEHFDSVDHLHFRSHIALLKLDDTLTPKEPVRILPPHAEAADQDANLFLTSTGRLIQYGFLWYPVPAEHADRLSAGGLPISSQPSDNGEAYIYWGGYTRYSDDFGATWSDHQMVPGDGKSWDFGYRHHPGGAALRGRMIELDDGTLLQAGYEGGLEGRSCSALRIFRSSDMAESWQLHPDVIDLDDVGLQEPAMALWPKGEITIFNRTTGNDDRLVTASSCDGGATFDTPRTIEIMGHPYDPLVLRDGRLLLVYGYRHYPMGVRARLVDPGQPLEEAPEIIIRDDSPSRDTGYPSAIQLADGRIVIAYYITDKAGIRGIECTVVALD